MNKSKGGRPPFKPTEAQRRKVSIAAGAGMTHEEIALAIGISRPTLAKHFEHELSVGAYEKRLEVLSAMHKAAKGGNVAAQKAYIALTPAASAPPAEQEVPQGKKAKANADAKTAQQGTDWDSLLGSNVVAIGR